MHEIRPESVDDLVKYLCNKSRLNDAVVIGPVVWEQRDGKNVWYAIVAASHNETAGICFHCDQVILAEFTDATPNALVALAYIKAFERCDLVARMLKARFSEVHTFECELDCAEFCAERWPGQLISTVLASVALEKMEIKGSA